MHNAIDIRPLAEADSDSFCSLIEDNKSRFSDAGLAALPTTSVEYIRWLSECAAPSLASQTLKLIYGVLVVERGSESMAGFVGVESLNRFRGAGVWYGLGRQFHGKGIAKTAVMSAMADFTERSKRLGLSPPPRWVLHALKRNFKSQNLAASIGFKRDEMLDYTRTGLSSLGGQRFDGFVLQRSGVSLREEATARQKAVVMAASMPMPAAVNDPFAKPASCRLRA